MFNKKAIISKHKVYDKINYRITYDNDDDSNIVFWCTRYDITHNAIYMYDGENSENYIGSIFINKRNVIEK